MYLKILGKHADVRKQTKVSTPPPPNIPKDQKPYFLEKRNKRI